MAPKSTFTLFQSITVILWVILAALFAVFMVLVAKALVKYLKAPDSRKDAAVIKRSLGEALKAHRIERGMTQEFVAEHMGVSRQTVSKWETGINEPSTSNLLRLAKLFELPAEELLREIRW